MKCPEYKPRISALADGELTGAMLEEVRAHVDGCEECGRVYEEMLALQNDISVALLGCDDVPDIASMVGNRIYSRPRFRIQPVWAVAAVLAMIVIGSYTLVHTYKTPPSVVIATHKAPRSPT